MKHPVGVDVYYLVVIIHKVLTLNNHVEMLTNFGLHFWTGQYSMLIIAFPEILIVHGQLDTEWVNDKVIISDTSYSTSAALDTEWVSDTVIISDTSYSTSALSPSEIVIICGTPQWSTRRGI